MRESSATLRGSASALAWPRAHRHPTHRSVVDRPLPLHSVLSAKELELLLCGLPTINVEDWRENATYRGDYSKNSKAVKWFWQLVKELSHEKKARLLQFTCGTARVPVEGFKALKSYDGRACKFCVQSMKRSEGMYPRSHTCFNRCVAALRDLRRR